MLAPTHFLAGAAAGFLSGGPIDALCGGLAALLPDVDHPGSWAGRRAPGLSFGINLVAGHRGVLHSLLGAGLVTAVLCWLSAYLGLALPWRSMLLGYLSHLALDTLTPGGVAWLFPFKRRVSLGIAKTGGGMERFVFLPLLLVCLGWLFHHILKQRRSDKHV